MSTVRGVGMPKTTEKYIAVVHYEAGDPSATVFAIDDTARQAIAAAKGEDPDDDFVSFPATAALAGVLVIFVQKVTLSKFLILLGNHSVSRAT